MVRDLLMRLATEIDYGPLPRVGADDGRIDTVMSIIFGIAGAVALLFLVIGGLRMIISRGDPSATAQAKGTIIYSLVGLIVVIISFSIVTFVINNI